MAKTLMILEQDLNTPCGLNECIGRRLKRIIDGTKLDLNNANFSDKLTKLEEYYFGAGREGVFSDRILALEWGQKLDPVKLGDIGRINQLAASFGLQQKEGVTSLGKLVEIEEEVFGAPVQGSIRDRVLSMEHCLGLGSNI